MTTTTSKNPLLICGLGFLAVLAAFAVTARDYVADVAQVEAAQRTTAAPLTPARGLPVARSQAGPTEANMAALFVATMSFAVLSDEETAPGVHRVTVTDHGKTCRIDLRYGDSAEKAIPRADGLATMPAGWSASTMTCD
jgi:hypothetical protein